MAIMETARRVSKIMRNAPNYMLDCPSNMSGRLWRDIVRFVDIIPGFSSGKFTMRFYSSYGGSPYVFDDKKE